MNINVVRRPESLAAKVKNAAYVSAGLCAAAGIGAGLMYFLDPNRGKLRRALIRDRFFSTYHKGLKVVEHKITDLENHVKGAAAEAKAVLHSESVSDPKLEARVRTKLGHSIEHPHAVRVTALEGNVILTGEVSRDESARAERAARSTAGVKSVENLLELTT